jgi:hypothetical protein
MSDDFFREPAVIDPLATRNDDERAVVVEWFCLDDPVPCVGCGQLLDPGDFLNTARLLTVPKDDGRIAAGVLCRGCAASPQLALPRGRA